MKNELIRFAPLFAGLTDEERTLLADGFVEGRCDAQTVLLQAGERSDGLYLIGQGFVTLASAGGASLATLGPGSLVGDSGLFRGVAQDVTVVALADVQYWKLTDDRLRELIVRQPSIGLKLGRNTGGRLAQMEDYLVQRLSQVPELGGLPRHTLAALAARMQPREVKAQDALYRAGDRAAGLFLVESGSIELRSEAESAEERALGSGALFGALALLTGKPYSQSAVATAPSLLWVVSADDFGTIATQHPGLRRSLARTTRTRLSKTDQSQAVLRLAQIPLFAEAPPQVMQALAQRVVLQHFPAGERVYTMGELGDALYLVENGEIELTGENAAGALEQLGRIGNGGAFGEMGLLTGQIRGEDATAVRNTNVWILPKAEVDTLAARFPEVTQLLSQSVATRLAEAEQPEDEARFRRFPLLADLGATELQQVMQHLRPMRYRSGEQIFRATSPADTLYLLERGQVRFQPLSGGAWILGPGETFGERSLLSNQPHNATVIAESDVDVWTLAKQDFDMLMNRYPMLAISMSRLLTERLAAQEAPEGAAPPPPAPQGGRGQAQGYGPAQQGDYGFADEDEPYEELGYAPTPPVATTNIPSRRRRPSAVSSDYQDAPPPRSGGIGQWFANLSTLGKVQLAVLVLLLIWLIAIAAPWALLNMLQGTGLAREEQVAARSGGNLLSAINAVYAIGSYELLSRDKELAQTLAMADQAVPPTPTYTPVATQTPIPTATPLPTATPTPLPTATFTPTPAPVVFFQAPAAPPPAPEPEAPPPAPVAARAWDGRLSQLGVNVEEAPAAPGQQYWRLIEARWADERESGGKHHIYVEVLDEGGNRIVGHPVTVFWGDGSYTNGIEDKAPPDFGFNYQMYAAGNAYNVKVEGLPSDVLRGAGMGSIEQPRYGIHTSFYLTYQRATR